MWADCNSLSPQHHRPAQLLVLPPDAVILLTVNAASHHGIYWMCILRIQASGSSAYLQESSGEGDALALAPRQESPPVPHLRVIPIWQIPYELRCIGRLCCGLYLRLRAVAVGRVADVVRYAPCKLAFLISQGGQPPLSARCCYRQLQSQPLLQLLSASASSCRRPHSRCCSLCSLRRHGPDPSQSSAARLCMA